MSREYCSRECLICGRENPAGIRARFGVEDGVSVAVVTPPEHLQGFKGVLHGGIVTALLDDAMWYAAYGQGMFTLTGELGVRFRRPVEVGRRLEVRGRMLARRGRLAEMSAEIRYLDTGELVAEATGKFMEVSPEVRARLSGPEGADAEGAGA